MAYFPFFMDIEGQRCLIVGGGIVACRKVEVLLDYGPEIVVVSPEMTDRMVRYGETADDKVTLLCREYQEEDLDGVDFVVAATADEELNRRISLVCRERRIPVNVVDVREECSFIFPALNLHRRKQPYHRTVFKGKVPCSDSGGLRETGCRAGDVPGAGEGAGAHPFCQNRGL